MEEQGAEQIAPRPQVEPGKQDRKKQAHDPEDAHRHIILTRPLDKEQRQVPDAPNAAQHQAGDQGRPFIQHAWQSKPAPAKLLLDGAANEEHDEKSRQDHERLHQQRVIELKVVAGHIHPQAQGRQGQGDKEDQQPPDPRHTQVETGAYQPLDLRPAPQAPAHHQGPYQWTVGADDEEDHVRKGQGDDLRRIENIEEPEKPREAEGDDKKSEE